MRTLLTDRPLIGNFFCLGSKLRDLRRDLARCVYEKEDQVGLLFQAIKRRPGIAEEVLKKVASGQVQERGIVMNS